jgi:transcriptional regulator with XRE-family HTH domain
MVYCQEKMIGKRIKELRKRFAWSQQKLAEKAGLSYNVITKIEQGVAKNPNIQTLVKLSDAFNISLDDLIGRKIKKAEDHG